MKNGAELLDRLVKDIVSESASTYISILQPSDSFKAEESGTALDSTDLSLDVPTAFQLTRFIPLLKERIYVINPFTRTFLVSWVTLLDTIPDLELVVYLPAFLGGLFKFLSDPNRDVHVATQGALERFLSEIKKIAKIKQGIAESRKSGSDGKPKVSGSNDDGSLRSGQSVDNEKNSAVEGDTEDEYDDNTDDDWIPGQDIQVDHPKILEILVNFLDPASESGK